LGQETYAIRLDRHIHLWLKKRGPDFLRTLLAQKFEDPKPKIKAKKLRFKRDRFLEAVRHCFHARRSMEAAGVTEKEVEKWTAKDPAGFKHAFKEAQRDFVENMEWMTIECARGERTISKQGMTGLIAFLNNHHPSWGRVKIELLSKIFQPIFDSLLKIVRDTVDDTTYKQISEKFNRQKTLHFSAFSD
jgi:hypothetical protein